MSLLPEINQASAEINKFVAQANIHQTIAPVNPAEFTSPADTLLLASRDPVIREVSVGMTGVEAASYTVSGTPPLSLPNSIGEPLKAWSVDLLPYQEGTGDPSPDNVRPIHGTDKLNLFVEESYDQGATPKAVIDMPALGKNILNIDASNHNAWAFVNIPNNLQPNTEYTFSINGTTSYSYVLYLGNYNQSTRALTQAITAGESFTFTTPSSMSGEPLLAVAGSVSGAGNESLSNILPQVELGDTKTSYEPFTNTLYGGTIGSEGGESRSAVIVLNGLESWAGDAAKGFYHPEYRMKKLSNYSNTMMCETLTVCNNNYGGFQNIDYAITGYHDPQNRYPNDNWIYVRVRDITSVAELKAWLAENPVTVVFELATPTTFAVPSATIPTPTGTAATWATAEDGTVDSMSVTYVRKA